MKKIIFTLLALIISTSSSLAFVENSKEYKEKEKYFYDMLIEPGYLSKDECTCLSKCMARKWTKNTPADSLVKVSYSCSPECIK